MWMMLCIWYKSSMGQDYCPFTTQIPRALCNIRRVCSNLLGLHTSHENLNTLFFIYSFSANSMNAATSGLEHQRQHSLASSETYLFSWWVLHCSVSQAVLCSIAAKKTIFIFWFVECTLSTCSLLVKRLNIVCCGPTVSTKLMSRELSPFIRLLDCYTDDDIQENGVT